MTESVNGHVNGVRRRAKTDEHGDRPEVVISAEEHDVNDAALDALCNDSSIFSRSGLLVHIVRGASGKSQSIRRAATMPRIVPMAIATLRERLARSASFVRVCETEHGRGKEAAHPPEWCCKAIHARGNYPELRPLEGISGVPILRSDGSVFASPGYDPETALIYDPTHESMKLPAEPDRGQAIKARELLLKIVADFPFKRPAHVSTWLAALLTAVGRRAIDGPAPLFLFDANVAGSGKTKLAAIVSLIVDGRDVSRMANPNSDEECRKLLLALAIGGDPIVLIDNVTGRLGCASLDAALTGTHWRDRILGKSAMVDLPLSPVWLASGNNVILAADTSRRVAHCRLDSTNERPEERDDFQIPDLLAYVQEHRVELLAEGTVEAVGLVRTMVGPDPPGDRLARHG
jgi:hypothetical protein